MIDVRALWWFDTFTTSGAKGVQFHFMDQYQESVSKLTTPLSERGLPRWFVFLLGLLSFVYILNPGAGFIEFIPDNIPVVGNLDEGAAALLIWYAIVEFFEGGKFQR